MIEIRLKCKCTGGELTRWMRERGTNEDIHDYMEYLERQIGIWHSTRGCPETKLEYMKIMLSGDKPIGVR